MTSQLKELVHCTAQSLGRMTRNLADDGAVDITFYDRFPCFTVAVKHREGGHAFHVKMDIDGGKRAYFAEVVYPGLFWNGYRPYVYAHRGTPVAAARWVEWNLGPALLLEWVALRCQRGFRARRAARRAAASLVQRTFRRANVDPGRLLCRRRLAREFEGLE